MKKWMSIWKLLILLASMSVLVGFDGCGGDDDDYDYDDSVNETGTSEESSYVPVKKSLIKVA